MFNKPTGMELEKGRILLLYILNSVCPIAGRQEESV